MNDSPDIKMKIQSIQHKNMVENTPLKLKPLTLNFKKDLKNK